MEMPRSSYTRRPRHAWRGSDQRLFPREPDEHRQLCVSGVYEPHRSCRARQREGCRAVGVCLRRQADHRDDRLRRQSDIRQYVQQLHQSHERCFWQRCDVSGRQRFYQLSEAGQRAFPRCSAHLVRCEQGCFFLAATRPPRCITFQAPKGVGRVGPEGRPPHSCSSRPGLATVPGWSPSHGLPREQSRSASSGAPPCKPEVGPGLFRG